MADNDHEIRIHDLERDVEYLKKSDVKHKENNIEIRNDFNKLFRVLSQIRWTITGAVMFFLASEFGMVNIIKAYFI